MTEKDMEIQQLRRIVEKVKRELERIYRELEKTKANEAVLKANNTSLRAEHLLDQSEIVRLRRMCEALAEQEVSSRG